MTRGYNSSQAAVLAIWLTFLIYVANTIKSAFPWVQVPVWIFCISQIVTLTSAIKLTNMTQAVAVVVRLLEDFLSGLGLGAGVSLLVFPMDCRQALFGSLRNYFQTMQILLDVQSATLNSLETHNPWFPSAETTQQQAVHKKALKSLSETAAKIRAEQSYAEREIAVGKLGSNDISALVNQVIRIIPALSGLAFVFDLLASRSAELSLVQGTSNEKKFAEDWHSQLRLFHDRFDKLTVAMKEAIEHILKTLQLKQQASQTKHSTPTTGTPEFLIWYDAQIQEFSILQSDLVQVWIHRNNEASMARDQTLGPPSCAPAPLALIYVSLEEFVQQIKLIESTDLLPFRFREP